MSQYDVALGLDHTTLDSGISQLYADSQARVMLFKGARNGQQGTESYSANWDMQRSPTFSLTPVPQDKWLASINDQGVHPQASDLPTQNTFTLNFPQFYGQYTLGGAAPISGTTEVDVFGTVTVQNDTLSIIPLAIWIDESRMSGWDQLILNEFILKPVLQQASTILNGLHIPPLSFSTAGVTISLTPPVISIQNEQLLIAASLISKGSVDISGVTWPQQSLFLLLSRDVMSQLVTGLVDDVQGKPFTGKGKKDEGTYTYSATPQISNVQISGTDLTKINAQLGFTFSAQVSIAGCAITSAVSALG